VGDESEFTCSQVTTTETLLHRTLASVDCNIQRPIRVSLKKEGKFCMCASGFLHAPSSPLCFVSTAPVLGQHARAYVASGGGPGARGSHRC
jgi:hypothetical protein